MKRKAWRNDNAVNMNNLFVLSNMESADLATNKKVSLIRSFGGTPYRPIGRTSCADVDGRRVHLITLSQKANSNNHVTCCPGILYHETFLAKIAD